MAPANARGGALGFAITSMKRCGWPHGTAARPTSLALWSLSSSVITVLARASACLDAIYSWSAPICHDRSQN